MKQSMKFNLVGLLFGAGFGFVLAAANLHEYATIHAMLSLEEIDVFLLMGLSIGVGLPLLAILERAKVKTVLAGTLSLSRSKVQKHHVVGGAIFGIGWAVSGTCPAPALVMLASGAGLAAVTIAGLFIGLGLRDAQTSRANGGNVTQGDGEHRVTVGTGN
jgi:uncharacterized membrane protein YedE/YeeE